jgi:hypothetical protein
VIHKRGLLSDLGYPQLQPTVIGEDNQAAIAIATNPGSSHKRTKHIHTRERKICEWVEEGSVEIKYVNTKSQLADLLTKALSWPIFNLLRGLVLGHPTTV